MLVWLVSLVLQMLRVLRVLPWLSEVRRMAWQRMRSQEMMGEGTREQGVDFPKPWTNPWEFLYQE